MLTDYLLKTIRKDIETALSMVEATHNMKFDIGRITYQSNTFTCKLKAAISNDGQDVDFGRANWDAHCRRFGFTKNDFGKSFESSTGRNFTICGIAERSTKYPILGKSHEDGEVYKHQVRVVMRELAKEDRGEVQ